MIKLTTTDLDFDALLGPLSCRCPQDPETEIARRVEHAIQLGALANFGGDEAALESHIRYSLLEECLIHATKRQKD